MLVLLIGTMALLGILYAELICNIENEQAKFVDGNDDDCLYPTWGVKTLAGILSCLGVWPAMMAVKKLFRATHLSRPMETSAEKKERHRIERVLRQRQGRLVSRSCTYL